MGGWGVGRGRMDRLLVGGPVVDIVVVLAMPAVCIRPLQLGLERVVLLAKVLLPVVVGVAPPVAPLEGLVCRHVDVLEVVVPGVAAVSTRTRDRERTSWSRALGSGVG